MSLAIRLGLALAFLLAATPASAAVIWQSTTGGSPLATTTFASNPVATNSIPVTVPSGLTDTLMVITVAMNDAGTVTSVTRGVAAVFICEATPTDTFGRTRKYFIMNPAVGTNDVVAQFSPPNKNIIAANLYSGVDQAMNAGAFQCVTSLGTGQSPALTVTSAGGELVEDTLSVSISSSIIVAPGGAQQTSRWNVVLGGSISSSGSTRAGSVSAPVSWTVNEPNHAWAMLGIRIRASGPPDTIPPTTPPSISCSGPTSAAFLCTWPASTDANPVSYEVDICTTSNCSAFTTVVDVQTTQIIRTGFAASTTRWFRVRATDGTNITGNSPIGTATTSALTTDRLSWTDNSNDESNFAIYACEPTYPATTCDPTVAAQVATTGANVAAITLSNQPNPVMCYAVNAQKAGAADSGFTNTFCSSGGAPAPTVPGIATGVSVVQP